MRSSCAIGAAVSLDERLDPYKLYPKKKRPSQRRTERVKGIHKKTPRRLTAGQSEKGVSTSQEVCYMNTFIIAYFYKFVKPISKNYTCC